jgi:dTDP-4-amino-4,6-dideoxygalactose transaminase
MPSFTFVASAHAVCNAGLIPYLTDVDPNRLL